MSRRSTASSRRQPGRLTRVRQLVGVLLVAGAFAASGCGKGGRPLTVPVQGRVTLSKGAWPVEGQVYFLPLAPAEGLPRRPATAPFGTDGKFSYATSWTQGDGVVPGRYRVYVECWKVAPTRAGPPPVSYTIPKYQSGATSDIEVEISEDSTNKSLEWDFPAQGV